jgi:transposase
MQIIGLDPHPTKHVAALMDQTGKVLAHHSFPNTQESLDTFLRWAAPFSPFHLAVEGPTHPFFALWLAALLAEGISITPVPAQEVSLLRRRRGRGKSDLMDAVLIGKAYLTHPDLPTLATTSWLRPLQELSRTRKALAEDLKAHSMRLEAIQEPSVRKTLLCVVHTLESEVKRLEKEITRMVRGIAPELLHVSGIGPVLAGALLAESGDVRRFPGKDSFAAYCGAAPITWQSGVGNRVRVNASGNRRLNSVLHLIALTRLRVDERTRCFCTRKMAEGKTKREALRALKTYLAREMYHTLNALLAPQEMPPPTPSLT